MFWHRRVWAAFRQHAQCRNHGAVSFHHGTRTIGKLALYCGLRPRGRPNLERLDRQQVRFVSWCPETFGIVATVKHTVKQVVQEANRCQDLGFADNTMNPLIDKSYLPRTRQKPGMRCITNCLQPGSCP